MAISSGPPGSHPPDELTHDQHRQQLQDSIEAGRDKRSLLDRHDDALTQAEANGGFTTFEEYTEALDRHRRGLATKGELARIQMTPPEIVEISNRPG